MARISKRSSEVLVYSLFALSPSKIFFGVLILFFSLLTFNAYAQEASNQDPKKWVIASVRDGELVTDDGLLKAIEQDVENQKRKQIENQLGFLSKQLGGMPNMPKVESLEGMSQIPEVKGKTFNYPGISEEALKQY